MALQEEQMKLLLAAAPPVAKKKAPSKTVIGNSLEIKNDGFAQPLLPMNARLTFGALERLPACVKISGPESIGVSVASSFKSANGMIKRHCEPRGFILAANWSQHKKGKHGGVEVFQLNALEISALNVVVSIFEISNRSTGPIQLPTDRSAGSIFLQLAFLSQFLTTILFRNKSKQGWKFKRAQDGRMWQL